MQRDGPTNGKDRVMIYRIRIIMHSFYIAFL